NPDPIADKNFVVDFTPKYYGGFQNSITYKGFQFDFHFHFVKGKMGPSYLYNYIPGSFNSSSGGNQPISALDRWQKPGDVKRIQKFSQNLSTFQEWKNAT